MDTKKLSLFLDENTNYDKSSNKIFIDKLLNLCSYHNFFGDTKLMYLPGSNGIDEFVNEHCNRFTFVNNDSTRHITVIFEENEVRVTGAYESWNSKGYSLDSTYFKRFYLTKQSDQINAFDFSIDYLLKVEKCNAAINEISSEETNYLHKADYVDWIIKYEHLKDEQYGFLFYPFLQLENFNYLFFILSQYKFYVELNDDCIKANQEYIVTDISNEDELLKWLIKFEKLGNSLDAIKETPLNIEDNEEEFETGFVTVHDKMNIKIAVADFKNVLEFFDNFFTPYMKMHEKYGEVDNTEINEDFKFPLDYKSLQELVNERRQRS